jgi:hypothetical protein
MEEKTKNEALLDSVADVRIKIEKHDDHQIKRFKGKFVITKGGKFIAKIFPVDLYNGSNFFHNNILEEIGIEDAQSDEVKNLIAGGGKIEVELLEDHAECRIYGKSTNYGPHDPAALNLPRIEEVLQEVLKINVPIQLLKEEA